MGRRVIVVTCLLLLLVYGLPQSAPAPELRAPLRKVAVPAGWWRGNTHTHTLWSDGRGAPEWIVRWYRDSGYHFLVLSDHNVMQFGERWVKVGERLSEAHLEDLRRVFGSRVQVRTRDGRQELRLATLPELQAQFQAADFLLMAGEELTDHFQESVPVHVNGLNLAEPIPPQGGSSVREVMNRNVDAVYAQAQRLGRPTLAHLNHPSYKWAVTWEDLAHLRQDRFFEVYNGHHLSGNPGDATHPATEVMWDRANSLRLTRLQLPLLYGLATDDAHEYEGWGLGRRNPGRGWLMVRAPRLETGAILKALHAGDFYASTGVVLQDFGLDGRRYWLRIRAEAGVRFKTRFYGRSGLLAEKGGHEVSYTLKGDELFVRAVVLSSRAHPNPDVEGEPEKAWIQPVRAQR